MKGIFKLQTQTVAHRKLIFSTEHIHALV